MLFDKPTPFIRNENGKVQVLVDGIWKTLDSTSIELSKSKTRRQDEVFESKRSKFKLITVRNSEYNSRTGMYSLDVYIDEDLYRSNPPVLYLKSPVAEVVAVVEAVGYNADDWISSIAYVTKRTLLNSINSDYRNEWTIITFGKGYGSTPKEFRSEHLSIRDPFELNFDIHNLEYRGVECWGCWTIYDKLREPVYKGVSRENKSRVAFYSELPTHSFCYAGESSASGTHPVEEYSHSYTRELNLSRLEDEGVSYYETDADYELRRRIRSRTGLDITFSEIQKSSHTFIGSNLPWLQSPATAIGFIGDPYHRAAISEYSIRTNTLRSSILKSPTVHISPDSKNILYWKGFQPVSTVMTLDTFDYTEQFERGVSESQGVFGFVGIRYLYGKIKRWNAEKGQYRALIKSLGNGQTIYKDADPFTEDGIYVNLVKFGPSHLASPGRPDIRLLVNPIAGINGQLVIKANSVDTVYDAVPVESGFFGTTVGTFKWSATGNMPPFFGHNGIYYFEYQPLILKSDFQGWNNEASQQEEIYQANGTTASFGFPDDKNTLKAIYAQAILGNNFTPAFETGVRLVYEDTGSRIGSREVPKLFERWVTGNPAYFLEPFSPFTSYSYTWKEDNGDIALNY